LFTVSVKRTVPGKIEQISEEYLHNQSYPVFTPARQNQTFANFPIINIFNTEIVIFSSSFETTQFLYIKRIIKLFYIIFRYKK